MSQTLPSPEKIGDRPANNQPEPPEEQFWQRYSAHGELPLSGATSLAVHLLILGLMVLTAWLAYAVFSHTSRTIPVEAVRLDLGGGGGSRHGTGDGPGVGTTEPREDPGGKPDEGPATPDPVDNLTKPKLDVNAGARSPVQFDPGSTRVIQQSDTSSSAALQKLAEANIRIRLPDKKGYGQGGTGTGGGSGDGKGTGVGNGEGEGRGTLTQREKRMLRWSMLFNTNSGPDYFAQLQGLGAILAIPVKEDGEREYKIVRDLSARPAKLLNEDIGQIQRIYWIDNNPQSVADIMSVLGVRLRPSHFVAFMPEKLEANLFKLESNYLKNHHPGKTEDDIDLTKFRINRRGGGYEPEVISLKLK